MRPSVRSPPSSLTPRSFWTRRKAEPCSARSLIRSCCTWATLCSTTPCPLLPACGSLAPDESSAITRPAGGRSAPATYRKTLDALILLTVEELAINELREPFHHWTRTYQIPVRQGDLGDPLPYQEPTADRAGTHVSDAALVEGARHIWEDAEPDLRTFVQSRAASLTEALKKRLEDVGRDAIKAEQERFRLRLKEVERAMSENTIAKLEKERDHLIADLRQLTLIDIDRRVQEDRLRDLEAELQRRSSHFNELLARLKAEQDRVLSLVLPKRYQLRQSAQVFPVAVEIRLPGNAR